MLFLLEMDGKDDKKHIDITRLKLEYSNTARRKMRLLLYYYRFMAINNFSHVITHTHARTHTHNHFTALLDFVWDYLGEPAPET